MILVTATKLVAADMTKAEAQAAYRAAWRDRCLTTDLDRQKAAERVMDAVQPYCCDEGRPNAEWRAFVATLPGYVEFWEGLAQECVEMQSKLEKK